MTERGLPSMDGAPACPFVAFGDDRDGRSTSPDHRHRCFAESPPAPRALAHQEAYCLSSAFPVCPTFQDWARREAAHARGGGDRAETAPTAVPSAPSGHPDQDPRDEPPMPASGDLPVRRNPPRDWAAPPPWAGGAGASGRAPLGGAPGDTASEFLAGRTGEGQGLAGSAADRLAGGSPPVSGAAGSAAAAAAWSASAAGSTESAPDDELAGLVQPRPSGNPAAPADPEGRSLPPRTGRRPAVSSTRQPEVIPGPTWERMRRYEAYPTIRTRAGLAGFPGLPRAAVLAGALAIAALALFMLPWLLGFGGGGGSGSSPTPGGSRASANPSAAVTAVPAPTPLTYTIKSKDNLLKVANMFHITLEQLLAANPQITNPDKIALGQVIFIPTPGAGGSAKPSGSKAP